MIQHICHFDVQGVAPGLFANRRLFHQPRGRGARKPNTASCVSGEKQRQRLRGCLYFGSLWLLLTPRAASRRGQSPWQVPFSHPSSSLMALHHARFVQAGADLTAILNGTESPLFIRLRIATSST